jgi:hypothetical protein
VDPRAPTEREIEVVNFLLPDDAFPDVEIYREQAGHLQVTGRCGCGCPSVALSVDASRARQASFRGEPLLPVEAEGIGEDFVQVILFARHGWLEYRELVCFCEPAAPAFPPLSELRLVKRW